MDARAQQCLGAAVVVVTPATHVHVTTLFQELHHFRHVPLFHGGVNVHAERLWWGSHPVGCPTLSSREVQAGCKMWSRLYTYQVQYNQKARVPRVSRGLPLLFGPR